MVLKLGLDLVTCAELKGAELIKQSAPRFLNTQVSGG